MPPKKTESAAPKAKSGSGHATYQVSQAHSDFQSLALITNILKDMIHDAIVNVRF